MLGDPLEVQLRRTHQPILVLYRQQRILIAVGKLPQDPAYPWRDSPDPCVVVKAGPVLCEPGGHTGRLIDTLVFGENVPHILNQLLFSLTEDTTSATYGLNFNGVYPFSDE